MLFTSLLICLAYLTIAGYAKYVVEDDYLADGNFFSMFDFWTEPDPTNGFVEFVSYQAASSAGMIKASSTNVKIGVDSTNVSPNGRPSTRLMGKKLYNSGLFIADITHMPGGTCGTWPAFWMLGPNWPAHGEIDIIEGVNDQSTNYMTLHTTPGCWIDNDGGFSGNLFTPNCDINAVGQAANIGCQFHTTDTNTFGARFNSNGGGVYAVDWNPTTISVNFFPRSSIPADITSGVPNPSSWGTPVALFKGCDIDHYVNGLQLVFETTFCGSWASDSWGSGSCGSKASSCNSFVENNPTAFADAYWSIDSLKIYQDDGLAYTAVVSPVSNSTTNSTLNATLPDSPIPQVSALPLLAGNSTNGTFPTGSAASGSAPSGSAVPVNAIATGGTTSLPSPTPSAVSIVSVSPVPNNSSTPVPNSSSTPSTAAPETTPSHHNHHIWDASASTPPALKERHARHLKSHKKHGAGLL